jgi:hypothetical protein
LFAVVFNVLQLLLVFRTGHPIQLHSRHCTEL